MTGRQREIRALRRHLRELVALRQGLRRGIALLERAQQDSAARPRPANRRTRPAAH